MLQHPAVKREIDVDAIALYLECQYIPAPYSIYRHIRKLRPGHSLTLVQGELTETRYWLPDYSNKLDLSDDEAVKLAVCGNGSAVKGQVQRMVGELLGLPRPPQSDHAADALAVAICHAGVSPQLRAAPAGAPAGVGAK